MLRRAVEHRVALSIRFGLGSRAGDVLWPEKAVDGRAGCHGKDLRATVYADDSHGAFAEENDQDSADLCARYNADTIAKAKALMAGSYGIGFKDTCREIEGRSDAEIACGKKAFDALAGDARDVPFKIPVSCSGTQTKAEVDRCVKDLGSIKVSSSVHYLQRFDTRQGEADRRQWLPTRLRRPLPQRRLADGRRVGVRPEVPHRALPRRPQRLRVQGARRVRRADEEEVKPQPFTHFTGPRTESMYGRQLFGTGPRGSSRVARWRWSS